MLRRDLRDPEALGQMLHKLRKQVGWVPPVPLSTIADELGMYLVPNSDPNPSCVERYGRPDDVTELWERIQIR